MPAAGENRRIADRLLAEGRIVDVDHHRAVEYASRHGVRVEDALVQLGIVAEPELLKYISTLHETRFVSTEKLSRASIHQRVLSRLTREVAEAHGVFPVLFDDAAGTLSVVTADPDDAETLQRVKQLAGVREVLPLVARPAAVRAAIQRHYGGDADAFAPVLRAAAAEVTTAAAVPRDPTDIPLPVTPVAPSAAAGDERSESDRTEVTSSDQFLEALSVLVTLLEQSRQDLRGHSAAVARLTRKTCERIGVGRPLIAAFAAAAYVHDLGKMGAYHLTALNVAEYDGHRVAALKAYEMPAQLMASVGLSAETLSAVTAMYERYDGQGFPEGLRGKDIPLGARILALVDTYADLTHNPRNPYRKMLGPEEAMDALGRFRGTIFDPNVVDVFSATLRGDPAASDPLSAKLRELTDKRSSRGTGVSGSLAQMSLPAMVQVLWHGRKTCALKIEAQDRVGEIHFADGQVYNAHWGSLRGEEAFYEMLALHEGVFRLDASFRPSVRAITASPEALLLEGMRRLDESGQPRA